MPSIPKRKIAAQEQLGMDLGTATHRLRKQIFFRLVQRLGDDVCYKCGTKIDICEQLSIEHKKPWLHVDPALFWDIDNIAFSHLACNRPDRPASEKNKRVAPQGKAWCCGHKAFLPEGEFSPNKDRWSGLNYVCRACNAERQRLRDQRVRLAFGKTPRITVRPYSGLRRSEQITEQMSLL